MIQKEVAVRLAEPPGSKEYGILCGARCRRGTTSNTCLPSTRRCSTRPPRSRAPLSACAATATERLGCDEALFVKVVKASFGQRAQDDPQLAADRVRRFRRRRASLLHAARRAAGRRRVRGANELGFAIFDFIGHLCTCIRAARMGRISILPIRAALRLSTNLFL